MVDVAGEVVEVEGAVVTGVVVVVADTTVVDVAPETVDEVEPELVVCDSSPLQLAIVRATRTIGTRRFDFTVEVWHALCRLPDQGVCLVATFHKLECAVDGVDDGHRAVVEAAHHQSIIAERSPDGRIDRYEMAEHDRVGN